MGAAQNTAAAIEPPQLQGESDGTFSGSGGFGHRGNSGRESRVVSVKQSEQQKFLGDNVWSDRASGVGGNFNNDCEELTENDNQQAMGQAINHLGSGGLLPVLPDDSDIRPTSQPGHVDGLATGMDTGDKVDAEIKTQRDAISCPTDTGNVALGDTELRPDDRLPVVVEPDLVDGTERSASVRLSAQHVANLSTQRRPQSVESTASYEKSKFKRSRIRKGWLIKRVTGYSIAETEYGVSYLWVLSRKPDRTSADNSVYALAGYFNWKSLEASGLLRKERKTK